MPSFAVGSEVDNHALTNAVDQPNRPLGNRYDLTVVDANFERNDYPATLCAEAALHPQHVLDVLQVALLKNGIDIACLDIGEAKASGKQVKQEVVVRTGLESDLCKKMVKLIKDKKMKVQAQIQGDQVRVTGKKRDDLQTVMAMLREAEGIDMPLQFTNFRD